jgi:hypothetical protein
MSGARHRRKGDRCERQIVGLHLAIGIKAERYPLSGASRFRGSGHDVHILGRKRHRPFAKLKVAFPPGRCAPKGSQNGKTARCPARNHRHSTLSIQHCDGGRSFKSLQVASGRKSGSRRSKGA